MPHSEDMIRTQARQKAVEKTDKKERVVIVATLHSFHGRHLGQQRRDVLVDEEQAHDGNGRQGGGTYDPLSSVQLI